ncbi:unnamed protein product [Arabis nemorensis]|uniref:Uncharacterized protein n=1 Tax=Arabis nemorensis TaxID=586526 RepID=A0A565AVA3_9BRAS|nr:unnamed protein product [Arabis nemorensis]
MLEPRRLGLEREGQWIKSDRYVDFNLSLAAAASLAEAAKCGQFQDNLSVNELVGKSIIRSVKSRGKSMAKSNRNKRRNVGETGETSSNATARNVAAYQEEVQNVENVGNVNVVAAAVTPVGLEVVMGLPAQVLARQPVITPAPVAPPLVVNVEQVLEDVDILHGPRIPSYL